MNNCIHIFKDRNAASWYPIQISGEAITCVWPRIMRFKLYLNFLTHMRTYFANWGALRLFNVQCAYQYYNTWNANVPGESLLFIYKYKIYFQMLPTWAESSEFEKVIRPGQVCRWQPMATSVDSPNLVFPSLYFEGGEWKDPVCDDTQNLNKTEFKTFADNTYFRY